MVTSILRYVMIALLVLGLHCGAVSAAPMTFDVFAFDNSTSGTGVGLDTGINLSAGQMFTVMVDPSDLWSAGDLPRWSNADGLVGDLFTTGSDESGEPAGTLIGRDFGLYTQFGETFPFGTLVGSIAASFFALGINFDGAAPASGNLLLYYWDSNNFDNEEFVATTINVGHTTTVPEPATLALLSLGLAGLCFASREKR